MITGRFLAAALLATMITAADNPASHAATPATSPPLVIAHRGASGYLPEHTLLAVTAAHTLGADFIEQDIVLSADGVPVVLHDIHLETTTDVASRFPERARADGRWYAIDFSLAELKQLTVTERRSGDAAVYPARFPVQDLSLRIPTLDEEIRLISGLNRSRQREVGLYIEFKAPAWHGREGQDIVTAVLSVLQTHGLNQPDAKVFLQCFDPATLRRIKAEGLSPLPLIQLLAENAWGETDGVDYTALQTPEGLATIAQYAWGIGPWIPQLFAADGVTPSTLVEDAHRVGLGVHPYTLRRDDVVLPASDFDALQRRVLIDGRVDGVFTDFPDLTRQFIDRHFGDGDDSAGHFSDSNSTGSHPAAIGAAPVEEPES